MPRRKKKPTKPAKPCPDPEKYMLVNGKDGPYWKKKPGIDKPVVLNAVFQRNVELTPKTNSAATSLVAKLQPYMERMRKSRLTARMAGRLKKACNAGDRMDYRFMEDLEMQEDYHFVELCKSLVHVTEENGTLYIKVQTGPTCVYKHSKLPTGYFFELILLWGDPEDKASLRTDSVESGVYSFEAETYEDCHLRLELPTVKAPWMALVKVGCLFPKKLRPGSKYYGMKVVKSGGHY